MNNQERINVLVDQIAEKDIALRYYKKMYEEHLETIYDLKEQIKELTNGTVSAE